MRQRCLSCGLAVALALTFAGGASARGGVKEFIQKVFKVALAGQVSIPLPGPYPLGPTPLVLRSGTLTITKTGASVRIKLTALGVPLCTATLSIDSRGVALDCDADFKVFRAHLGGHLDFDFKSWGIEGSAALEIASFEIAGAHIELGNRGFRAVFTLLGADLSVGPVTASDLWGAIKSAALALINPYELAKKAAKAVAKGAKVVAGAVADGAKAVGRGAKAAAKKVGSVLSSAASALFGGGTPLFTKKMIEQIKAKQKATKDAKDAKAKKAAASKAEIKAMCEAFAGRIVRDSGLDKAEAAAAKHPALGFLPLPPFNCDLKAKVASIVRKVKDALAKVGEANQKIHEALKPGLALAEAKKRGLVKFYRCSVTQKKPECLDLWPYLDPKMRELAEKFASQPLPKKRRFHRPRRKASGAAGAEARATQDASQASAPAGATGGKKGRLVAPPLPAVVRLVKGLGFRVKPTLASPFVFDDDKYIEAGKRLRVTDIVGEPGQPGAFCQVSRKGKDGFIRCDGAFFRDP